MRVTLPLRTWRTCASSARISTRLDLPRPLSRTMTRKRPSSSSRMSCAAISKCSQGLSASPTRRATALRPIVVPGSGPSTSTNSISGACPLRRAEIAAFPPRVDRAHEVQVLLRYRLRRQPHGFEGLLTVDEDANVADLCRRSGRTRWSEAHAMRRRCARPVELFAQEREHPLAIDLFHAVKLHPEIGGRHPRRPSGNASMPSIPSYTPPMAAIGVSNLTSSVQQAR